LPIFSSDILARQAQHPATSGLAIMALQAVDHVVVMVPDLEAAIRDYTQLGFTVVRGGSHPAGTHNALIAFADGAYVELIAFERKNPQHRWWAVAQKGGGLIDFCMRTDDLAGDRATFRAAGVEMEIAPGERVRPDGYRLRWTLAQPGPPYAFVAPFLIEDETPREERVPGEHRHRNAVRGIATIIIAVEDVAAPRRGWSAVLRQQGEETRREDILARGVRFCAGPHALELMAPEQASSPLSARLNTRGAGPWSMALRTSASPQTLDADKARARIVLVP
jgi:catechol 2,3-dioxygenase-like lactoylglutathione lyase family enzyme